ncbi:MAG: SHOCT domain-containing protein [Pelagibacterales bacterium]|nr:SHOCT domain-containing protein [Pelagibacterales bacterium]
MKKLLGFLLISFLYCSLSYAESYKLGDQVFNKIKLKRNFEIDLSEGNWFVARKEDHVWRVIHQKLLGFVRIENGEFMEAYDIYEGDVGGQFAGHIDDVIYKIIFKDKYDGCYEKPEYFVVEFIKKGRVHNCMVVGHWDLTKELNNPDDPQTKTSSLHYRKFFKENSIKLPRITLNSWHSYYSRHNRSFWYRVNHVMNPKILNAPKNQYFTEERSEYHKYNIEQFPKHKKIMEEWLSISSKYHKEFEKKNYAKKNHELDLSRYIISDKEPTQTDDSNDIVRQIQNLNELYKSGVLTKEEFEKAKKKLLNK